MPSTPDTHALQPSHLLVIETSPEGDQVTLHADAEGLR